MFKTVPDISRQNKRFPRFPKRRFPKCHLLGTRIVWELPPKCPLREPNALETVGVLRDRGFALLRASLTTEGLNDLHRADVCYQCIDEISGHPTVRKLRPKRTEVA